MFDGLPQIHFIGWGLGWWENLRRLMKLDSIPALEK